MTPAPPTPAPALPSGGGVACATCTVSVSLLRSLSQLDPNGPKSTLDHVCEKFPTKFFIFCEAALAPVAGAILDGILADHTPDRICADLRLCHNYPECSLWPVEQAHDDVAPFVSANGQLVGSQLWDYLKHLFESLAMHEPLLDLDQDGYSKSHTLRGANWRGKDCDDTNSHRYPGATAADGDASVDSNCNGIYGSPPDSSSTYEELWCDGTDQLGFVVLGDSASAHFEIPPDMLNATAIYTLGKKVFAGLESLLEDEMDWPMRSAYTGFAQSSPSAPVHSVYELMRERNLCIHRDFQNMGVNGARSGACNSTIVNHFSRKPTDHPALVVVSLIGNDVCNGHHSLSHMTSVDAFRNATLGTLAQLDAKLAPGSHVLLIGLADGEVLWNAMANRTHPIGVPTSSVYAFLNCLKINPCWVWLNHDADVRAAGTAHARKLSAVYQDIIETESFNNFDMGFLSFADSFDRVIANYTAHGGQAWELVEPVDGFHPGPLAQPLIAQDIWSHIQQNYPHWVPRVNPNNANILSQFGDQGGY